MNRAAEWEALPEGCGAALVCEPRGPPPFLTDGCDLYEVVGWRAGHDPGLSLEVRRLAVGERRRVRRALLEAAEETYYQRPKRRRR
jgi:hypothetical protein